MIRTDATPQMPEGFRPYLYRGKPWLLAVNRQIMAERSAGQHSIQDFTFAGGEGSRPGRRKRHRTKYEN